MPNFNPVDNLPDKTISRGKGRPKGSKDKFPQALKAKVLFAAAQLEANGMDLGTEALKDPKWFWETFVKPMLPKEVDINLEGNVTVAMNLVLNG
jgi:hypothetical protein